MDLIFDDIANLVVALFEASLEGVGELDVGGLGA